MTENDKLITETVLREQTRLYGFIRNNMLDHAEAEDVLQEVFYEFVEASRLLEPIEQIGAWLFRVARNRMIDRFRKKKEQPLSIGDDEDELAADLADLLPSNAVGPEASYAQTMLMAALHDALDELPAEQRDAFIAHELDNRSFKELAAETGVSINTLLARKRYAIVHLRSRLQDIYQEFDL